MKKEAKKLLFIAAIAFIGFLIAFGKAFYECGANGGTEGLAVAFVLPVIYLILTVTALVMMHNVPISKKSYIVMSVLSTAFIAVAWIVYLFARGTIEENFGILWYPIVLTVLSVIMSVSYISLVADIIKSEKKTDGKE